MLKMHRITIMLGILCFIGFAPDRIQADDTEIFIGSSNAPPNILYLLDTSATMKNTDLLVHAEAYDPSKTYTAKKLGSVTPQKGSIYYSKNVFKETEKMLLVQVTNDISKIICTKAYNALWNSGMYIGNLSLKANSSGKFECTASESKAFYNGNYLNYLSATDLPGDSTQLRQKVARDAIKSIVNNTADDVARFSIMGFDNNKDDGGNVALHMGSTAAQFNTLLDDTSPSNPLDSRGTTPLAESLAEAGLYYAGKPHWSEYQSVYDSSIFSGSTYVSPIQYRCQKNYVIIITDGMSTNDTGVPSGGNNGAGYNLFLSNSYINNKTIISYAPTNHLQSNGTVTETNSEYGTHMLDDVAGFLYNEDLKKNGTDLGGGSYDDGLQNVITYTIGFMTGSGTSTLSEVDQLLTDTAARGGGKFYQANNAQELVLALTDAVDKIMEVNSQFVSPVVPVNRVNRTYADNGIYLGLFLPDESGLWKGNIKKFGFSTDGVILDVNGIIATSSNGSIMDTAHSAWVSVSGNEGMKVDKGGFGAELLTQSSRTFKTFKTGSTGNALIDFNTTNILPADLGLSTTTQRDDLINFATASGVYAPNSGDAKERTWILGDIIHSQPAVLYDATNHRNVIFAGGNDGFLHCLTDNDADNKSATLTDDTVTELWSFIPWDLLPKLQYLPSTNTYDTSSTYNITGDTNHDYFVDGSPVVYKSSNQKYLAFGLRRGGKNITTGGEITNQYTILNITNYTLPSFVTYIPKTILGTTSEPLGQSWSTPYFCKLRTGTDSNKKPISHDVLLFTGGYDTNQDTNDPGAGDSKGRAIFAYDLPSSTGPDSNFNFNHTNYAKMRYCMVDLGSYDDDGDGCDDTIYAPSVGGDLFVFNGRTNDGNWTKRLLFSAYPQGGFTTRLRKFFYAPGIAQEMWGDFVYIGSGDRENPSDTTVTNRFYAVRNTWPASWNDNSPITDSSLTDVSDDVTQGTISSPSTMTDAQNTTFNNDLSTTGAGWYFNLENTGEKVVSSPLVFNKVVYFTTFSPESSSSSGDLCLGSSGTGTGRLYAVNYLTGEAVFHGFNQNGSTTGTGKPTKEDRNTIIGSGIPSEPTLVITEHGSFLVVATSKGTGSYNINELRSLSRYFWLKQ